MSANTETTGADRAGCKAWCGAKWPGNTSNPTDEMLSQNGNAYWLSGRESGQHWCSSDCRDARLPPIAAPAAHIERRKGQRWKSVHRFSNGDVLTVVGTLAGRSGNDAWSLSDVERSDGITLASCFVDSLWTERADQMTLLADAPPEPAKACESCSGDESTCGVHGCPGGKIKTCPTCEWAMSDCACTPPAQEAPKAAPVCSAFSPTLHGPCAGNLLERARYNGQRLLCDRHYLAFETRDFEAMNDETKPTGILRDPDIGERLPRPHLAADWVEDCLPESGR